MARWRRSEDDDRFNNETTAVAVLADGISFYKRTRIKKVAKIASGAAGHPKAAGIKLQYAQSSAYPAPAARQAISSITHAFIPPLLLEWPPP
jgi:hypothetical protein